MKYLFTVLSLFVLALGVNAQSFDWEWQNPKPQGNNLNDVAALTTTRLIAVGDAGTILISNDGGQSWSYDQVDTSGNDLTAIEFVNSTTGFISGENGLILKTVDGGNTWTELVTGTSEKLWNVNFIDASTGYACGAAGTLLRTTNGGTDWAAFPASPATNIIYTVTVNSAGHIFVGNANASGLTQVISRSTDNGATWENVTPSGFTNGIYDIVFTDNNTGYVIGTQGKILKTTDGGATFAAVTSAGAGVVYGCYFASNTTGYVVCQNGFTYFTTDGGTTWTEASVNGQNLRGIVPSSTGLVVVGASATIALSNNNAISWTSVYNNLTVEPVKRAIFVDENTGYVCGGATSATDSIGFILKTTDGGLTWTKLNYEFKNQVMAIAMPASGSWYAATGDNRILKSTDEGATWTSQTLPITGTTQKYYEIAFADENYGFAAGAGGKIIKTTNGGTNWTSVTNPFGTGIIYDIEVLDSLTAIGVTTGAKAYKTTDGGLNWTALNTGILGSFFGIKFKGNFGVLAGYQSGTPAVSYISVTHDGGNTWTPVNAPDNTIGSIWAIGIQDTNTIWAGDIQGYIAYTNDGGNTWTAAKTPCGNALNDITIVNGKMWLVGNGGTIIKGYSDSTVPVELTAFTANIKNNKVVLQWQTASETNNKGFEIERRNAASSWKNIAFVPGKGTTSDASSYVFEDADYNSGKIYYRLKQVDYDGTIEYSNTVELGAVSPVKFELSQNYPNPFNPSTSIKYAVPQKEHVTLKVYNVLGKEVAVLVNDTQEAGNYNVKFDASAYSSGVYFYELTSGANRISKKMILIK